MKLYQKLVFLGIMLFFTVAIGTRSASATELNNDNRQVTMIKITSMPDQLTYSRGESLDLAGMEVKAYYDDGTEETVTDYQIIGYNSTVLGNQTIIVLYKNFIDYFSVTVLPEKVTNIRMQEHDGSFTLSWDEISGAYRYDLYVLDLEQGDYVLKYQVYNNSITLTSVPDAIQAYRVRAVVNVMGIDYQSDFSDPLIKAKLGAVTELVAIASTATTIDLSWSAVENATGYMIYRSPAGKDDYTLINTTPYPAYTDSGLSAATAYKYKVCAYVFSREFTGGFSPVLDTSTSPKKPTLKTKAGENKARLTWKTVTGASYYDIYMGNGDGGYELLATINGNSGGTYLVENLQTDESYRFYIIAVRLYKGVAYPSERSDIEVVFIEELQPTSNTPKLFPTEEDFYNSWTYKKLTKFFSKYVNYEKSYAIPGLITTNVGGFSSSTMCPQGLTFAGEFLLMSAYDLSGEENSVIYVVDKKSKELLTTLVLPSKPHAGGLAFDGSNVWVTIGAKVAAIRIADIREAADSGAPYVFIQYAKVIPTGFTASYCTYYDEKLWIGTYDEIKQTNMYSYLIEDKYIDPKLSKKDTILMPNRVQGVAFTDKGTLIISRSCQIHSGMRGYMRQLDVYKPDFANAVDGVISLGKLVNSVSLPSMNEGIAIDGNYLYVTYETGVFEEAKYKMDRITAFKLTDVVKKKS